MTNAQTAQRIIQMVKEGRGYLTKDGQMMLRKMIHEPMQSNYSKVDTIKLDTHDYTDIVMTRNNVEKVLR